MPETPMDENNASPSREHEVRSPWKSLVVEKVSKPETV
jgi:hypothetical protein